MHNPKPECRRHGHGYAKRLKFLLSFFSPGRKSARQTG